MKSSTHNFLSLSWRTILQLWLLLRTTTTALHHNFYTKHDHRKLVGPVGVPFGFLKHGYFDLEVYDFKLEVDRKKYKGKETDSEILSKLEAGFILKKFDNENSFYQYMEELRDDPTLCAFEYYLEDDHSYLNSVLGTDDATTDGEAVVTAEHGIYLPLSQSSANQAMISTKYKFKDDEEGLYFLIYQICPSLGNESYEVPHAVMSTYELNYHFINFDSFNRQSYLTAGEMNLPMVFFYFAVSYAFCTGWWIHNIRKIQTEKTPGKPTIYAIHHLMSVLIVVKTITVFLESIRYHYLRVVGHAELWSFVYYTFYFLKGTFLFVVILLIGSGWSIVKPFLNGSEKKVILAVLVLQVVNNIALTVLAQETEGESSFEDWTAILHLVDIVCCCAVLVPIVWQVNQLEKSIEEDPEQEADGEAAKEDSDDTMDMGEKGRILAKLKLFRSFYMLVVAYIYSTRILIYIFAAMLNYKQLWIRYFVVEVVTLSFYVVTGYYFRPTVDGPYQGVKKDADDDGDDDTFVNERELEMS